MGQQPNIEITLSDLPVAEPEPEAARRWSPDRPAELSSPSAVPWGGHFGTPGPDAGYALTLARRLDLSLNDDERRVDAEVAIAALASARASYFGRAPVPNDVVVAAVILCFDRDGIPAAVADRVAASRSAWTADLARHAHRAAKIVSAVPIDVLTGELQDVRAAVADGAVL